MKLMPMTRRTMLTGLLAAGVSARAGAQAVWPAARPITVIVPFAAGGPTDILARRYCEFLARDLRQTFVIENVAGAGGTSGSARAARAAPDGYTLLVGQAGTHVAAVGLYKKLAYDPVADFEQIALFGDLPQILVTRKSLPVKDFKEFVDYVGANGDKMSIGTAGAGSSSHMGASMLNLRMKSKAVLVSYRGTGPAMNDLVAGQIDAMVEVSLTAIPQIQAGTVNPIAVFRNARVSTFPDIPATSEFGIPGLDFKAWIGLLAPKGTPADVVDTLNASVRKANADRDMRAGMAPLGLEPWEDGKNTPAQFRQFIAAEIERWVPLIKDAG